ncbi:helix-turn-helix domain-containing protein [Roseovarius sp. S1116L3]|uniref:helix-turn-helix domain-containing protein n=1 Tax=Roseovarius roseus TaxID=3342636 RepID=UPI003727B3C2
MDGRLALVRATHLSNFVEVLRDLGVPVDRDLAQSRLPPRIEETPDLYVSVPLALEWIARSGRDFHPMELGFLGAQRASLDSLRPAHQAAIVAAQTGLKRLEALIEITRLEDSALGMSIQPEMDDVRVVCSMAGLDRHLFVCFAEWLNLQAIISIIRSVMGASWYPREICFVSSKSPPAAVREAFPNTRILMGQPHSSVTVARAELAQSTGMETSRSLGALSSMEVRDGQSAWEFVSLLRMMVQPYLNEGRIDVAFAAEISGISTRTLQRMLAQSGSSYSKIVQEARFDLARTRLDDPDMKVIDVAMMVGYESPQHFSRAFRRFTGVTPSQYRKLVLRPETGPI